jgi:transketolase
MGIETFGKSAPFEEVYKHFNLTSAKIVGLAKKLVKK